MTTDLLGRADLLRPGTILLFRFPLGEGEGCVKSRPCLVIATSQNDAGKPLVTIAYGTSAATESNRGLDLDLCDPQDWRAAGLHRQSRFVLARRVTVPLSDVGLHGRRAGSPVIGVLPPSAMVALRQLTRSLGARITTNCRRGSVGTQAGKRHEARQHGQREPIIVRVRRRRYERPGAMTGKPRAQPVSPTSTEHATLRLAAARR